MNNCSIHAHRHGQTTRIVIVGDLRTGTIGPLHDAVAAAMAERPLALIVDLGRMTYMDSAGLRALVITKRVVDTAGCLFELQHLLPYQRRIFDITGLADVFDTAMADPQLN